MGADALLPTLGSSAEFLHSWTGHAFWGKFNSTTFKPCHHLEMLMNGTCKAAGTSLRNKGSRQQIGAYNSHSLWQPPTLK